MLVVGLFGSLIFDEEWENEDGDIERLGRCVDKRDAVDGEVGWLVVLVDEVVVEG